MEGIGKKKKLAEQVLYGLGSSFTNTFVLMLVAYYLMYFMTDVLGINTYVAAALNTAISWIKILTMIAAGVIIDGIVLKWGKYRSWCMLGAIGVLVALPLMYTNFGLSQGMTIVIFMAMYVVQMLAYNTMWVAQRSLVGVMSRTSQDGIALNSISSIAGSIGGILYGVIGSRIIAMFSGDSTYAYTALIYGVFLVVGNLVLFIISRPYEKAASPAQASEKPKQQKIGIVTMLKSLRGPMIPYFISMTIANAQSGFFTTLLAYFSASVLGDPLLLTTAISFGSIGGLFGAWFVRPICKRMSSKKAFIMYLLVNCVLYVLIAFWGKTATAFLAIYTAIGFMNSFIGVLLPTFANDIADYSAMNGNASARAFVQAMGGTSIRIGSMISTAIASFGVAMIGYSAGMQMTESLTNSLTNLLAFGPAAFCLVAAVFFLFYRIDETALNQYRKEKFGE